MHNLRRCVSFLSKRTVALISVSVCTFVGIVVAMILFPDIGTEYSSLMRRGGQSPVSIVWVLFSTILPFAITFFSILHSRPGLLFFFVSIKSTIYCVLCFSVFSAFGSSGWLVCLLLLFSQTFELIGLIPFCVWVISAERLSVMPWLIFGSYTVCFQALNLFLISPFASSVIIF